MARHGRAGDDGERSPAAQRASTVTGGSETRPPASASADPFAHVPLDDGQRRRTARRAHRGRVLDSPSRVEGWLGGIEPAAAPVNVEDPWDHEQHAGHEKPRKPEDPPGDVPDDRNPDPQPQPQRPRARARPRARVPVLAGMVAVGMLAIAGAAGRAWVDESQPAAQATCVPASTTTVVVAADPTIAPAIVEATADLGARPLDPGGCVTVSVIAKDPLQTAAELSTLPAGTLPDLWIPDSTTWLDRIAARPQGQEVPLLDIGSMASSPLIFAVDPASAGQLGWAGTPPTWRDILTSGRPVALADLTSSAVGFSALAALRSSVRAAAGPNVSSDLRAVLTSVAGSIDEGRVTSISEGFDRAEAGGATAPIVPTTAQQWFLRTRDQTTPATVPIRPRDGQVLLDYPLVRVDRSAVGQNQAAVEGVVRLLEGDGRDAAQALGFDPGVDQPMPDQTASATGSAPSASLPEAVAPVVQEAAPVTAAPVDLGPVLPPPSKAEVEVLISDISDLTRPARVLMVIDASVSMRAMAGNGTRATVARDATKSSMALFSDTATVGLWFFAIGMGGGSQDFTEVVPFRPMTADAGGVSQREALLAGADTLTERLTMGGTGLNDTVLDAVRTVRDSYVPDATNSVVVLTDGKNDDPNGIGIDELLATLATEADPARPVRVATVGIGEDTDAADLKRIAEATGGRSYVTDRPEDFQSVLFDALRNPTTG